MQYLRGGGDFIKQTARVRVARGWVVFLKVNLGGKVPRTVMGGAFKQCHHFSGVFAEDAEAWVEIKR